MQFERGQFLLGEVIARESGRVVVSFRKVRGFSAEVDVDVDRTDCRTGISVGFNAPLLGFGAVVAPGLDPFAVGGRRLGHFHHVAAVAVYELVISVALVEEDELLLGSADIIVDLHLGAPVSGGVVHVEAAVGVVEAGDAVDSALHLDEFPELRGIVALFVILYDGRVVVGAVVVGVEIFAGVSVADLPAAGDSALAVGHDLERGDLVVPVFAEVDAVFGQLPHSPFEVVVFIGDHLIARSD